MKKAVISFLSAIILSVSMSMPVFAETLTLTIDRRDRDPFNDLPVFTGETPFVNSPSYGNLAKMDEQQRAETKAAIEAFMAEHINDDMTKFEKEIQIIRWLVSICDEEAGNGWENATAYSCIVQGKAQCAGYADAFLQTAKMCGITTYFLCNDEHSWNLVQLDDNHFYHVDVTWEDPIGYNEYGFDNLRNKYINLTDEQIKAIDSHHTWTFTKFKAEGTMFGPQQVTEYLQTKSVGKRREEISFYANYLGNESEYAISAADAVIDFKDVKTTVKEASDYINDRHKNGIKNVNLYIRFPPDRFDPYIDAEAHNANNIGVEQLMDIINEIPFRGGGGAFFSVNDENGRPTMFFRCKVELK